MARETTLEELAREYGPQTEEKELVRKGLEALGLKELDPEDRLGFFVLDKGAINDHYGEGMYKNVAHRVGSFFRGFFSTLEKIKKDFDPLDVSASVSEDHSVIVAKEVGVDINIGERFTDLLALYDLWSRLLYYPQDAKGPNGKREKEQTRYSLDTTVKLYAPHKTKNGKLIEPPTRYQFEQPAFVRLEVCDHWINQIIILEFFPQKYSHFQRHPYLNGASVEEAKDILQRGKGRGKDLEYSSGVIREAEGHLVEPQMNIYFINKDREPLKISGQLVMVKGKWVGFNLGVDLGKKNKDTVPKHTLILGEDKSESTDPERGDPVVRTAKDLLFLKMNYTPSLYEVK